MADPRDAFRPVGLLGVASVPPAECSTAAATPLAAAFLAGLGVPEHAREAARHLVVAIIPTHAVGDDGGQCWKWHAPGLAIYLSVAADGASEACIKVASMQPEFVDGEVLRPKETDA
jgi:hypothetical protein